MDEEENIRRAIVKPIEIGADVKRERLLFEVEKYKREKKRCLAIDDKGGADMAQSHIDTTNQALQALGEKKAGIEGFKEKVGQQAVVEFPSGSKRLQNEEKEAENPDIAKGEVVKEEKGGSLLTPDVLRNGIKKSEEKIKDLEAQAETLDEERDRLEKIRYSPPDTYSEIQLAQAENDLLLVEANIRGISKAIAAERRSIDISKGKLREMGESID